MGFLSQLGLVLWKNLILRSRHKVILSLEILWPIIIFLVVTLVRIHVPPEQKDACHYSPRSNPSAGFQFVQDFVCNLDNKCYPSEEAARKSMKDAGTAEFLQAVLPLYQQQEDTKKFLQVLPQTKQVLDNIANKMPSVTAFDARVKSFLKNPENVRRYIAEEKKLLSGPVTDAILEASINITTIFQLSGNLDIIAIVCDPAELGRYLLFKGVDVATVSQSLCSIGNDKIEEVTNFLQQQVDIGALIKMVADMKGLSGDLNSKVILEDIVAVLNLLADSNFLEQFSILKQGGKIVQNIGNFVLKLTEQGTMDNLNVFGDLLSFVNGLVNQNVGSNEFLGTANQLFHSLHVFTQWFNGELKRVIDPSTYTLGELTYGTDLFTYLHSLNLSTDTLNELMDAKFNMSSLGRFIEAVTSNNFTHLICTEGWLQSMLIVDSVKVKSHLKEAQKLMCDAAQQDKLVMSALNVTALMDKLAGVMNNPTLPPVNWTLLIEDLSLMTSLMTQGTQSVLGFLTQGFSFDQMNRDLAKMMQALSNGDVNSTVQGLMSLLPLLEQMSYSQDADMYVYIISEIVDIMDNYTQKVLTFSTYLDQLLKDNPQLRNIFTSILDQYPDMGPQIIAKLLDPFQIQALLNQSGNDVTKVFCSQNALQSFLGLNIDYNSLSQLLCGNNITNVYMSIVNYFEVDKIQLMFNHIIAVLEKRESIQKVNYEALWQKISTLSSMTLDFSGYESVFSWLLSGTTGNSKWTPDVLASTFTMQYLNIVGESAAMTLGGQLEDSVVWMNVAANIKIMNSQLQGISNITTIIHALHDQNTELGKLAKAFRTYFPDVLFEFLKVTEDQTKFNQLLQQIMNNPMVLCDYNVMSSYFGPDSQLPLKNAQEAMCKLDYNQIITELTGTYNNVMMAMYESMMYLSNPTSSTTLEKNIDWKHFYTLFSNTSVTLYNWIQQPQLFDFWTEMDFTRLYQGLEKNIAGMMQQNMTIVQLMEQLGQILNQQLVSVFSGLDPAVYDMVRYYSYAVEEAHKVMKTYMEHVSANGILLSDFLGNSTLVRDISTHLGQSAPQIMEALSSVLIYPNKLIQLLLTPNMSSKRLCTDITIHELFVVQDATKLKQLETILCGVSYDALMQAITDTPLMRDFSKMMSMFTTYQSELVPANYTTDFNRLLQLPTELYNYLMYIMSQQQVFDKFLPDFLSHVDNNQVLEVFSKTMASLGQMDMSQVYSLIAKAQQLLQTNQSSPESMMVIAYIDAVAETHLRLLTYLDESSFSAKFPDLYKYQKLMDSMPDVLIGLLARAVENNMDQQALMMYTNPMMLCNITDIISLVKLPAESTIDVKKFHSDLCSIDLNLLADEGQKALGYLTEPLNSLIMGNMPNSVNQSELAVKIEKITQFWSTVLDPNMTTSWLMTLSQRWQDPMLWHTLVGHLVDTSTNAGGNMMNTNQLISSLSLLGQLNSILNLPALNSQLNMIHAILVQLNHKMGLLSSNSSLSDMFPNSPELKKLAKVAEEFPYIFAIIGASNNNPKFQALLQNQNITEVLLTLCLTPDSDLTSILTVPADLSAYVDLEMLRSRFCAVDFMKLEGEINMEFNVAYIVSQSQNTNPVNWTSLITDLSTAIMHLSRLVESSSNQFSKSAWLDANAWVVSVMSLANSQQLMQKGTNNTIIDAMQMAFSYFSMLNSSLGENNAILGQLSSWIDNFVKYMNKQLELLSKPNLSLQDLFADSPEVLKLIGSLNGSTELAQALLKIPLADTTALLKLQSESIETLCMKDAQYFKTLFQITSDQTAIELKALLCGLSPENWQTLTDELMNKVGVAELMQILSNNSNSQHVNPLEMSENIQKLIANLMKFSQTQFQLPAFDQKAIEELLSKLYMNSNAMNIDSITKAVMAGLAPLYGTPAWGMVEQYQNAADVVVQYINDMLALLQPDANGGLKLEAFFGDSETWKNLIRNALNLDPVDLLGINVRTEKLAEIMSLDSAKLQQLLCNESQLREYFLFPETMDVAQLVKVTCGLDTTRLMEEFNQRFDPEGLINKLLTPANSSATLEQVLAKYSQFVQNIMNLANITDPTFYGKSLADILNIDYTKLMNIDPARYLQLLQGNVNMNFTSVQDVFNFIMDTISNTIKQLDALEPGQSYSGFLKFLDAVLRNVLQKLDQTDPQTGMNTLSLSRLVGNITELEQLLWSTLALEPETVQALLSNPYPANMLIQVLSTGNMTSLQEYFCHVNISLLGANIQVTNNATLHQIQEQLCKLNYEELWEKIKAFIEYEKVMPHVLEMLGYTDVPAFNWTEYSENINYWKTIINRLLLNPPQADGELAKISNWLMNIIYSFIQQQTSAVAMQSMFSFLDSMPPASAFIVDQLNTFLGAWLSKLQMLKDQGLTFTKLLADPDLLAQMYTSVNQAWIQNNLKTVSASTAEYIFKQITDTDKGKLCDKNHLAEVLGPTPVYWNMDNITNILCTTTQDQWYTKLHSAGFYPENIHLMALKFTQYYSYIQYNPGSNLKSWSQLKSNLEQLTVLFTQLNDLASYLYTGEPVGLFEKAMQGIKDGSLMTLNTVIYDLFHLLDTSLVPLGIGDAIPRSLYFTAMVLNYTNSRINEMSNGSQISLENLIPNWNSVEEELSQILSQSSIDALMKLTLNTSLLGNLTDPNQYQNIVCNSSTFLATFNITSSPTFTKLQTELCQMAINGTNIMDTLLSYVNFNDFVKKLTDFLENKSPVHTDPYKFLQDQLQILNNNLATIGFDMDLAKMQRLLDTLMKASSAQSNLETGNICSAVIGSLNQGLSTTEYSNIVLNVLHNTQVQMELYTQSFDLLAKLSTIPCNMHSMNLTQLVHSVLESGIVEYVQKIISLTTSMSDTEPFDCEQFTSVFNQYMAAENRSMMLYSQLETGWNCFLDSAEKSIPALTSLDSLLGMLGELQSLMSSGTLPAGAQLSPEYTAILQLIVQQIFKQQPVAVKLMDLLSRPEQFENMLLQSNMTQALIDTVLKSTIDMSLLSLWSLSEQELNELICGDPTKSTVPTSLQMLLNQMAGYEQFCSGDVNQILAAIKQSFNISRVFYEVYNNIPKYMVDTDWLNAFIKDIISLTDLFGTAEQMAKINLTNVLSVAAELINIENNFDVENIIKSITSITDELKKVIPPGQNSLLDGLQTFVKGLQGLKLFSLLDTKVYLSDLLKDPAVVLNYMVNDLGFTKPVADSIIDAQFNVTEVLLLTQKVNLQTMVCNSRELSTLLKLSNGTQTVTLDDVSRELCQLTEAQIKDLVTYVQGEVKIGEVIAKIIDLSPSEILKNIGIDKEELENALGSFSPLQKSFTILAEKLQELPEQLMANAEALTQGITGDNVQSLSQLLCGRDDAFSMLDEYKLTSKTEENTPKNTGNEPGVRRKKRQTSQTSECNIQWTRWQLYEMSRFNNAPFCQDLYKNLQCSENGRIIWKFLKPLLVGYITYTPSNYITRAIMSEATKVFRDVEELRSFAKLFVDSASSLKAFTNTTEQIKTIQTALDNPLIKEAITSVFNLDANGLLNQLNSLNSLSASQLNAMTTVAQLIYNASYCMLAYRDQAYVTEKAMLAQADYYADRNELLAAVHFLNVDHIQKTWPLDVSQTPPTVCELYKNGSAVDTTPKHIKYKIRMDIQMVTKTDTIKNKFWIPGPEDSFADKLRYLAGFVQMQDQIERAIIKLHTGCDQPIPMVDTEQFPYPCYEQDLFQKYVSLYMFPVMMVLSWLVLIGAAIRTIVYDKEHRLEEAMHVMGMSRGVNWIGWFLNTFIFMLIMDVIITLFLHYGRLFPYSHAALLFVYLAVFSFYTVTLCYMVSVFFYRTTLAALVGMLFYLITYIPYIVLANLFVVELEFWQIFLACLSGTTAFSYGAQMLAHMEQRGVGMQWSDVTTEHYLHFSFAWVFYMMLIDSGICLLIGWYLRHVLPGKYGVSYPLYFFLTPSYWGCGSSKSTPMNLDRPHKGASNNAYEDEESVRGIKIKKLGDLGAMGNGQNGSSGAVVHDDPSVSHTVGISLRGLCKSFRHKKAVRGVTVDFYSDQITAFLGQNGAGKSTVVHLLTGIHQPSHGNAFINNRSILSDMGNIRKDLGICPQHDILFEYLTVREHLEFYASLKGNLSSRERKEDISRMLDLTGLHLSKNVPVAQLSGGQRRRLSVALAFIGGSNVVILDEPTSGIDSCARRSIWDLILQNRHGRTIVISTHHLDEADVLGDRIVLMHKGSVLATGSPMYLKSQYGSGYELAISHNVNGANRRAEQDAQGILTFLRHYIPDAELTESVGSEMTFILPTDQGQIARFPEMFQELERKLDSLGVSSYGVSDTTLEEVFLKLTTAAERNQPLDPAVLRKQNHKHPERDEKSKEKDKKPNVLNGIEYPTRGTPLNRPRVLTRLFALFYKRFWHHIRDFRSYLSQIILPVLFICLAMGMTMIMPKTKEQGSLLLTPELYTDSNAFYRLYDNDPVFKSYENQILNTPHAGPSCLTDSENYLMEFCNKNNTWGTSYINPAELSKYLNPGDCTCESGRQICPVGASGLPPPHMLTTKQLTIYNLTANQFPTDKYIKQTHNDFIAKRYGGWTFSKNADGSLQNTVWFNNKGFHALPAFQNALNNLMLRSRLADKHLMQFKDYGISVYNHPLNQTKEQLSQQSLLQTIAQNGIALIVLCAFCFVPAGYTIFLVNERVYKEKHLQLIYGVGTGLYWFTAIIWDMVAYMVTVGLTVLVAYLFGLDVYNYKQNLGAFTVILTLFGWACIPLMYLLCRLFSEVSTAYMTVFFVNFFIGVSTVVCIFLLSLFRYIESIDHTYWILSHVFKIFPQYCLGGALVMLSENQFITNIYSQFNIDKYQDPFSVEMTGWYLVAMAIQGFVFFVLTLILDSRCAPSSRGGLHYDKQTGLRQSIPRPRQGDNDYKEDSDVSLERQRVTTGDAQGDRLVIHRLSKKYRRGFRRHVQAVDNISVGVPSGECFGLLGVNGAGKTTTFSMITGEITPSKGAAALHGRVISDDPTRMEGEVGYCPQSDALDGYLTGRETLYFYGFIKGVPLLRYAVDGLLQSLGIEAHADRLVKGYSGGTKRKLCTAIALLGNPRLILLDEPTTGMDAGSRRKVWDRITDNIKAGTSVVLTSHSMMECDALCTRMAIMVNGRFMCLGNSQHLKAKYGTGYTLITRVSGTPPNLREVIQFVSDNFPGSYVKEAHQNQLEFELPMSSLRLSHVFALMEGNKSMLHIQEYSLSQPTLDQVFVNFARCQTDGLDENNIDPEEGGHIKAYANPAMAPLNGTPHTPILPRGTEYNVRESLKSMPGYGRKEIDYSDIHVDIGDDRPSTSGSSGDGSQLSTAPARNSPNNSFNQEAEGASGTSPDTITKF